MVRATDHLISVPATSEVPLFRLYDRNMDRRLTRHSTAFELTEASLNTVNTGAEI